MSYVARDVRFSAGGRVLLDGVSLEVHPGEVHALLGPNGAGKTTLLRLLAGEQAPASGSIALNGCKLPTFAPPALARLRAVLPQVHGLNFGFSAAQVVALGRMPCPPRAAADEDRIVREALALAGIAPLASRSYPTLSGGERARVQFARVMAQVWDEPAKGEARFLLLDEPTANLDLAHQHDCLRAVRTLAARGLGVLVILHDLNLALRYADAATLLREGKVHAAGTPAQAITAQTVKQVYGVPVRLVQADGDPVPVVVVREPRARSAL